MDTTKAGARNWPFPDTRVVRQLLFAIEVALVAFFFVKLDELTYAGLLKLDLIVPITRGTPPTTGAIALITSVSLVFVAGTLWLSQALRGGRFVDYGLQCPASFRRILIWTLLGGIALQLFIGQALEPLLERLFQSKTSVPAVPDLFSLLVAFGLSFIAGGLREEMFFRAYLVSRIKGAVGPQSWATLAGVAIQIAFFGYLHSYQGPVGIVATGVSAVAFTAAFLTTGNLWVAIMLHGFYDVTGFVLLYLGFQ